MQRLVGNVVSGSEIINSHSLQTLFCQNWDEESSDEEEESPIMEDPDMIEKAPDTATTDAKRKRQRASREQ
jgi:hypothetical protein